MATTSEKYATLVDELFKRTSSGRLAWSEDVLSTPAASIADNTISIQKSRNVKNQPVVKIDILDKAYNIIDTFTDEDLPEYVQPEGFESYWELLVELEKMAQRNASGADEALDKILGHLKSEA